MKTNEEGPVGTPEQAFATAINNMKKVAGHSLIPNFARKRLLNLITRTKLVADQEFYSQPFTFPDAQITSKMRESILEERSHANGTYNHITDEVLIRRSHMVDDGTARVYLLDLLAEEYGHGLRRQAVLTLADIPDDSMMLLPFNSKQDLLEGLNQQRSENYGAEYNFDPAGLAIMVQGFSAGFMEESEKVVYRFPYQIVLEEGRAAMIQTILEMIDRGMARSPKVDPQSQIQRGFEQLLLQMNAFGSRYNREFGALTFLDQYFARSTDMAKFIKDIFYKLMNLNMDQFHSNLDPAEQLKFAEMLDFVASEYRGRSEE